MSECKHDWQESYVVFVEHQDSFADSHTKRTQTKDVKVYFCPTCESYVSSSKNWEYRNGPKRKEPNE